MLVLERWMDWEMWVRLCEEVEIFFIRGVRMGVVF
jgi:hypothetical protein